MTFAQFRDGCAPPGHGVLPLRTPSPHSPPFPSVNWYFCRQTYPRNCDIILVYGEGRTTTGFRPERTPGKQGGIMSYSKCAASGRGQPGEGSSGLRKGTPRAGGYVPRAGYDWIADPAHFDGTVTIGNQLPIGTGVTRIMTDNQPVPGRDETNLIELNKPADRVNGFVHLNKPLLVRLNLLRGAGEKVRASCGSREIGRRGIRLALPCRLDLRSGSHLDMELFLQCGEDPVPVRGQVRHVCRECTDELVRYLVDIDFESVCSSTLGMIDSLIQTSEALELQHLPA